MGVKNGEPIAVWFSCGVASAVAAKLTVDQFKGLNPIRIINNPIKEEDEDNRRFLQDVEKWIGMKIENSTSILFPDFSAETVWRKRRYMSGNKGAPCTEQLKKEARRQWEDLNSFDGWNVFGFTIEEKHRHQRRIDDGMDVISVLINAELTKQDCFDIVKKAGIEMPRVYTMPSRFGSGFPNANCIGCVKATSPTYWNHVREIFPEVFEARAKLSRELRSKLVRYKGKRIFLDELPHDARGLDMKTMKTECSIFCGEK